MVVPCGPLIASLLAAPMGKMIIRRCPSFGHTLKIPYINDFKIFQVFQSCFYRWKLFRGELQTWANAALKPEVSTDTTNWKPCFQFVKTWGEHEGEVTAAILARYNRTDITLGHANVASTSWGQRQVEKIQWDTGS